VGTHTNRMNEALLIVASFAHRAQGWMEHGSYFVLFGLLFACGLGLPLPEDIPLLIGGALVARGKMSLALAAVCAWLGIIGGDCVLYHLGKTFGLEVKRIPMIGRHLQQKRLDQVHAMFERYGIWVVAVGRMFAGIRGAMVVVAGVIRFTFWKFLIADGLAAIVSGGLFLTLGYLFGSHMDWLLEHVEKGKKWAMLVAAVLALIGALWIYLHRRQKHEPEQEPGFEMASGEPARAPSDLAFLPPRKKHGP
jgi:membrane protein DedA with SNARE-associated domain